MQIHRAKPAARMYTCTHIDTTWLVSWLIHVCDMTHQCMWHNLSTCVAWLSKDEGTNRYTILTPKCVCMCLHVSVCVPVSFPVPVPVPVPVSAWSKKKKEWQAIARDTGGVPRRPRQTLGLNLTVAQIVKVALKLWKALYLALWKCPLNVYSLWTCIYKYIHFVSLSL